MIKQSKALASALALSVFVSSAASAATPAAQNWVTDAFAGGTPASVEQLSPAEMQATEGRLALVPFIAAVVSVDLALAGFFWGVYVPYATGGGGKSYRFDKPK
jgi:hypothetical protein